MTLEMDSQYDSELPLVNSLNILELSRCFRRAFSEDGSIFDFRSGSNMGFQERGVSFKRIGSLWQTWTASDGRGEGVCMLGQQAGDEEKLLGEPGWNP